MEVDIRWKWTQDVSGYKMEAYIGCKLIQDHRMQVDIICKWIQDVGGYRMEVDIRCKWIQDVSGYGMEVDVICGSQDVGGYNL